MGLYRNLEICSKTYKEKDYLCMKFYKALDNCYAIYHVPFRDVCRKQPRSSEDAGNDPRKMSPL